MVAVPRALAQRYYLQNAALRAQAVRDSTRLWRLWTPGDEASWRRMTELAFPVMEARHRAAQALAVQHFETVSAVAVDKRLPGETGPALDFDRMVGGFVMTGLVGTWNAVRAGKSLEAARQIGFARFAGSVTRQVLDGGRDAMMASVAASPRRATWRRVTSGDPCDFCAGLVDSQSGDPDFTSHDHCSCVAEPVFQ